MSSKSKKGSLFIKPAHSLFLKKIGKETAEQSIKESKALGLSITYAEDGKIIKEQADGKKEIIGEI